MLMRRPLIAIRGGVLLRMTKPWQSRSIATALGQLWRNWRDPQKKKKQSDTLRILFCGSDEFSSASLRALHEEKERNPGLIESIDVVVRPGKRVGRGLKQIQHPPIRQVAEDDLKLPVHERDTFTGWDMPPGINLIIAVSFGKLVPNRLLQAAKYGGLNVHPSLLPNLRGPAPLHHAILKWVKVTGVSLQTLDPHEFDKGLLLAQSPPDELIEIPPKCTVPQLLERVTPVGARMLVQGLRDGVHVPPLEEQTGVTPWKIYHAPKIGPKDRSLYDSFTHLNQREAEKVPAKGPDDQPLLHPARMPYVGPVARVAHAQRVIGPLWFYAKHRTTGAIKRVIVDKADEDDMLKPVFEEFYEDIARSTAMEFASTIIYGPDINPEQETDLGSVSLLWYLYEKGNDKIYLFEGPYGRTRVKTKLCCLGITRLKVDGQVAKPAAQVLEQFHGFPGLEHQQSAP
ncbi:formyl transferase [Apiospora marii]|uniref:methionyl-tRNA formyltransferase n=1 Tax=Apiospora marii TaxID=335849 RepID=A0ABR1RUA5_9PEZI